MVLYGTPGQAILLPHSGAGIADLVAADAAPSSRKHHQPLAELPSLRLTQGKAPST